MKPADYERLQRAALAGAAAERIARSKRTDAYLIAPLLLEALEGDPGYNWPGGLSAPSHVDVIVEVHHNNLPGCFDLT